MLPEGTASDGENRVSYSELELKALEAANVALELKRAYDSGELKGEPGDPYTLTQADKTEIVELVLAALPNGDEVYY